jgi:MFS family permease
MSFDRKLLAPMILGAILNPINSSIIAVSLVPIGVAFGAPPAKTAWLISALYVATAIGQPVVGRLVDTYGPRRLYLIGTALTGVAGLLGTLAPSFGFLVAARVVLGFGTCAGYPSAMYLIRSEARRTGEDSPQPVLTALAVSSQTIAVIGPTLGGLLIGLGGWRTTFAVNIPLAIACVVLGVRRLPRIRPEKKAATIDVDVPLLRGNRPLLATYLRNLLTFTVTYAFLYGFTQWLEDGRRLNAAQAGLILLPMFLTAIIVSTATGRRKEIRGKLLVGSVAQIAACTMLLFVHGGTAIGLLVGVAVVVGISQGLNSLANQNAVYHQADPARMGSSAGLLLTFTYLGAIVASAANGIFLKHAADTRGLHHLALFILPVAGLFFVVTLIDRSLGRTGRPSEVGELV